MLSLWKPVWPPSACKEPMGITKEQNHSWHPTSKLQESSRHISLYCISSSSGRSRPSLELSLFTSVSKSSSCDGIFKTYVTNRHMFIQNICHPEKYRDKLQMCFFSIMGTVLLPPNYRASLVKDNLISHNLYKSFSTLGNLPKEVSVKQWKQKHNWREIRRNRRIGGKINDYRYLLKSFALIAAKGMWGQELFTVLVFAF